MNSNSICVLTTYPISSTQTLVFVEKSLARNLYDYIKAEGIEVTPLEPTLLKPHRYSYNDGNLLAVEDTLDFQFTVQCNQDSLTHLIPRWSARG